MRAASALLLVSAASAQTYIVSSNGGGHFTDLPQAIAAVPDGATLRVRDGLYSRFSILGKGLQIIAERPNGAQVGWNTGQIVIGQLAATQRVVISGLGVFVSPLQSPNVRIFNAAGTVEISALTTSPAANFNVSIESCANVHFTDCTLHSGTTSNPPPVVTIVDSAVEIATTKIQAPNSGPQGLGAGGTGILIKGGSRVSLASSTVRGGAGALFIPATNGGPGIVVTEGSVLHAFGSYPSGAIEEVAKIEGGPGGVFGAADGGHGIVVQGRSEARVLQVSLIGGGASSSGTPGLPSSVETGSTLEYLPNALTPRLRTLGSVAPSQPLTLRLLAEPGSAAVLLVGLASDFDRPSSMGLGAITVVGEIVLAPLLVPSRGVLDVAATVPAAWAFGQLAYGQYLTWSPSRSEIQGSNMAVFVVR